MKRTLITAAYGGIDAAMVDKFARDLSNGGLQADHDERFRRHEKGLKLHQSGSATAPEAVANCLLRFVDKRHPPTARYESVDVTFMNTVKRFLPERAIRRFMKLAM